MAWNFLLVEWSDSFCIALLSREWIPDVSHFYVTVFEMNLNNSKYTITCMQKCPMKFELVIETQWYYVQ